MKIREWTISDLPAVQHIAWTTWLATYSSFIPEQDIRAYFETSYSLEKLGELCDSKLATGYLAEIDSSAVGFAKTSFNTDEKKFYLQSLYVLPEHQGKGIGTQLLRATEKFALTFTVDAIWLGVMNKNTAALEWYKKNRFLFVKEEPFMMGNTIVMHLIGFRKIKLDGH